MTSIWTYIKADALFREKLPHITSHKNKIRKLNGRGNPTDFSEDEKQQIRKALKALAKELLRSPL